MAKSRTTSLADWLKKQGRSCNSLAAELGRPHTTISRIVNGERWPRRGLAGEIKKATKGAVVFYPDHAPRRSR